MRMLETGIYNRLHNKMHYSKPSCVKAVSFRPLNVVDIRFAFDLIGGGLIAGVLILLAEVMRRKYRISRIQILQYLEWPRTKYINSQHNPCSHMNHIHPVPFSSFRVNCLWEQSFGSKTSHSTGKMISFSPLIWQKLYAAHCTFVVTSSYSKRESLSKCYIQGCSGPCSQISFP